MAFRGSHDPGDKLLGNFFPVFRATSPDGLTVLERLPRVDWNWGNGPAAKSGDDCLPLKKELSANELLHLMAQMMHVEYVADDPYPAEIIAANNRGFADAKAANAATYRAAGMNPPEEHADIDRAIVRFKNGSFTIKGQLTASIYCSANKTRAMGALPSLETHNCMANMRFVHAPEAQYQAAMTLLEKAGAVQSEQWLQAWTARSNQQTQVALNGIRQRGAASQAQLNASHEQFMQSQAMRQRMHQEFMNTMQRGTKMSMNRAQQNMNARSTATSNWVDYALDQQTVRDPSSGQVNKVSSQYSYT